MYSCASSAVASIKRVSFCWNATNAPTLDASTVLEVSDKTYGGNSVEPWWAVEDANLTVFQADTLLGLVRALHSFCVHRNVFAGVVISQARLR